VRILVDADSMQRRLRTIIVRAAQRYGLDVVFASNSPVPVPEAACVRSVIADDADEWLVANAESGDLAITHDIPLAARLVRIGVEVITDRGDHLTAENIAERSSERDLAMEMREAGLLFTRGGGFGPREIQSFANALDRELTARRRSSSESTAQKDRGSVDNPDRKG